MMCSSAAKPAALPRLLLSTTLAVVAEGTISLRHGLLYALGGRRANERAAFRCIAHDAVQDRPQDLRALQSHVVVGLVDDQLHGGKLRQRNLREFVRELGHARIEF